VTDEVVYLDHAATSPVRPEVVEAYAEALGHTGNASSLHAAGRAARRVVEEAREQVAELLGARPSEVVLTSGGTEADNLAVKGIFWARRAQDPEHRRIAVSSVEHHAVLDPAFWMAEHAGAEMSLLGVDGDGRLDVAAAREELDAHGSRTALVSVMWANNEVGTVQPLDDVVAAAHRHWVPVHSDAVQAVGVLDVDFGASRLDAMTVTAHKLGGPVGVGALLARRELGIVPLTHGGGQERGIRSGTVDAAGAHAFAVALGLAVQEREETAARLAVLRDTLVAGVLARVPGAHLRGPVPGIPESAREARLPGNAHFTFEGCEGDSLLFLLDSAGVCASTGSACQAGVPQPSHVLVAMGVDEVDARGALRFSLGPTSQEADVARLLQVLPGIVSRARDAGLSSTPARRAAG